MTDEREDRLDAVLREVARDYNAPPATPRAEIWERVQAERSSGSRESGKSGERERQSYRLPDFPTSRRTVRLVIGLAALLALGVAIGRVTAPATPGAVPAGSPAGGQVTANPGGGRVARPDAAREKGEVATQLVTVQHLGRVESFLTEFDTRKAAQDFSGQAQDLLSTTRLLLDSKRLTDLRTRKLLEDLELVLIQIATLNAKDRHEDLDFIADGLAQSHLRTRLRNAIPAGPAIRL